MMQKMILTLLLGSFILNIQAQTSTPVRKGAFETATIKLPTIQCGECKERIEKYMTREDGVIAINVDYKKKTCKITYYWDRTSIENIKTAIANIGYDADDVTADAEAYKKLPTCCKKPEDGGGH